MARINSRTVLEIACLMFLGTAIAPPAALCAKKPSKATTADGQPIRKVYIRSGAPDMTNAAARQLTQDTCLTIVPSPKQADAVLDLGIVLPGAGGTPQPINMFPTSPRAQTMGDSNSRPQRSASVNCSDDKANSGCRGSYNTPPGDISAPTAAGLTGNTGPKFDVSLTSPGNTSQELWEPDEHSKNSWSDQLRVAAGCPVCPDTHFDRHKYQTYRNWIQSKCPAMFSAQVAQ